MPQSNAAKGGLTFAELERSVGKKVVFMWGKNLQHGTLVGVDAEIFMVTVRTVVRGETLKIRLQLPRVTSFALVEEE